MNKNGDTESYEYDALNQLKVVIDALSQKTRFEYDNEGNLTAAIDAKNNRTGYTYDALGQNTHITFANNTTLEYAYDLTGNVIQLKKRDGAKIKFTYDVLDQLVEKLYPDGTTDKFGYNHLGQMISAINKYATVTLAYDKIGRIQSETLNGQSTGYNYNIPNRVQTLTYPSGKTVAQTLNVRDQIVEIREDGTAVVNQTYNKAGQMTSRKYNNGITTAYEYNANGWLSKIADGKILDLLMSYDKVGNMLARLDQLHSERSEVYQYDNIQQLISFKRGKEQGGSIALPTRMQTFRYDALGNRISAQEDGKTTNYAVNNVNEYTEIRGNLAMQYDANGNMVKDEAHTYRYDYNNKLVQVDDNTATYAYDALGRRIRKTTAEGIVNFFYAGDDVIEEQDGSKALLATYLIGNGIDDMIKMNRKGNEYFYHTNHLGSVMAVSDQSGTVQERYEYDPFGKVSYYNGTGTALVKSAIGNEVLFTGRSYNAESGLYDYRARAMNPNIGRFVQVDPLLYVDGMNGLSYVNNNSVGFIDPLGYKSSDCNSNSKPIIKAPSGPIMTSGDRPMDYKQPDPKSVFCIEHPYVCGIQGEGHGEGCLVGGIGACLDLGIAVDKAGIHFSAGVTPAVGLVATAGGGASSGHNLSGNNEGVDISLRANGGIKLGVGYGAEYSYNGEHSFSGTAGIVTAKGSTDGSIYGGVDAGVGGGGFVGIRVGKTWTFKWW